MTHNQKKKNHKKCYRKKKIYNRQQLRNQNQNLKTKNEEKSDGS